MKMKIKALAIALALSVMMLGCGTAAALLQRMMQHPHFPWNLWINIATSIFNQDMETGVQYIVYKEYSHGGYSWFGMVPRYNADGLAVCGGLNVEMMMTVLLCASLVWALILVLPGPSAGPAAAAKQGERNEKMDKSKEKEKLMDLIVDAKRADPGNRELHRVAGSLFAGSWGSLYRHAE